VTLDRIAQAPRIVPEVIEDGFVKNGTLIKVHWPGLAGQVGDEGNGNFYKRWGALELIKTYAAFNPHATFKLDGETYERSDPNWQKWRPDEPTSPHWYTPETLRDLIAAYVAEERRRGEKVKTVRAFVSEFRGLSSTVKQKEITARWSGVYLQDLVRDDDIDMGFVEKILADMKAASNPAKPSALGMIGSKHLNFWLYGAGVAEHSIKYQRNMGVDESGMPYVIEVAFGVLKDDSKTRILKTGMNWTVALGNPIPTLTNVVQEMRIDSGDPVALVVHLARPRFEFVDRGKTRVDW
jgi:hypothetical protein